MIKTPKRLHGNFPSSERHTQSNVIKKQTGASKYDLVVFSHLRWGFVIQRPQHIISRLAVNMKILFVEEPIDYALEDENSVLLTFVHPNITVLQPRVKDIAGIGGILRKLTGKSTSMGWFYSAAFISVLEKLEFTTIVYDCMDELSLFNGAYPLIIEQEKTLLSKADIVFTDGKSLYEAKEKIHHNVHCFPSSVEQSHFRKALNGIADPTDMENLGSPIIGYYGVIDERIDFELIDQAAALSPNATFVMIGPLVKVTVEDLPIRKNILYMGMRQYKTLPNYLKAFDIAMLPFVMKDSTKFINPTETLEYMAAGKPIISTPIYNVIRDYSNHVNIVKNAKKFCEVVDSIMKLVRSNSFNPHKYNDILQTTSWNDTVKRMEKMIGNLSALRNQRL